MARIKGGLNAKKKHKRVLKLAKGYRGARSKQYRVAKQSVMRALETSYTGRKQRKRQFRQLWIARINAAARINGLSYSKFMHGLKLASVDVIGIIFAILPHHDSVRRNRSEQAIRPGCNNGGIPGVLQRRCRAACQFVPGWSGSRQT